MNAGIDYGMGLTNIDTTNGIRYGVISQNSICQAWADLSDPDYGSPTCPKCGNDAGDFENLQADYWETDHGFTEYACLACRYLFSSDSAYAEEPVGYSLDDGEYVAVDCLDNDIMIIKSPYYTYAPFCSPCVPGAGNLDSAVTTEPAEQHINDWPKVYCVGHDWFDDGKAPYPVFRISDNSIVER